MNDSTLIERFENLTLPPFLWNHRTHIRIAYIYCNQFPFDSALEVIRNGIMNYNRINQVEESPTSGYNETTTVAFLRIVKVTMESYGGLLPTTDSEHFCDTHPHLLAKSLLRIFYSPERRGHHDAKTQFVEPDLCSLPDPGTQMQ